MPTNQRETLDAKPCRKQRLLLLVLLPLLYGLSILTLQPRDQFGPPLAAPWVERLLYDDFDLIAMSLRGLNASLGRSAGRTDQPPILGSAAFTQQLSERRPLQPRYFLEYPHATLLLFRLPWAAGAGDLNRWPAAILDGRHNDIHNHLPRTDNERQQWHQQRRAVRCYTVLMAICLVALMLVLHAGYGPERTLTGCVGLLVLPGALYFSLFRFDVLPALLMAVSLASLGRGKDVLSGVFLGVAVLVKVYPILLVPLILRFLLPSWARAIRWLVGFGLIEIGCLAASVALAGWDETLAPYRFQLTRPPEFGWTAYGYLLPDRLAQPDQLGSIFRGGSVLLAAFLLCLSAMSDLAGLLRRGAVLLLLFASVQVFYSPQWLLWLSPLLLPLARNSRTITWSAAALDLVTYLSFPVIYDSDSAWRPVLVPLAVFARCAIVAVLIGILLWQEFRRGDSNDVSKRTG